MSIPHRIHCAATLQEGLAVLESHPIDVIVLDLGLPDSQGTETLRRLLETAGDVPVVVLTALEDQNSATAAIESGAQDYVVKGLTSKGLLEKALKNAVERTRVRMRVDKERKRLERLKDEFIATVSHELRTPLTSISGSLGLLMNNNDGTLSAQASRLIAIAHTNCQRLLRLVNEILDIEKMESAGVIFNFEKLDVQAFLLSAVKANLGYAVGDGIRVHLEQTNTVHEIRTDPDRLAQVFANLLSNAIKFSPPNGEVIVSTEDKDDFVRISVRDHGSGIPDAFKAHVFERFAQADATNTRKKGGSGLGLSIVKQIVDRLGGAIGFEDAPGGGTIFSVDLPCWERRANMTAGLSAQKYTLAPSHTGEIEPVNSIENARRELKASEFDVTLRRKDPTERDFELEVDLRDN